MPMLVLFVRTRKRTTRRLDESAREGGRIEMGIRNKGDTEMALERQKEPKVELVDGYLMIDGELDPQIAELREELLKEKEETTWMPEEDPYLACVKIAGHVGRFLVQYDGYDPKDMGEFEFNSFRLRLRNNWEAMVYHRELVEETHSEEELNLREEFKWWVDVCCEGTNPVAAMIWLMMCRRLRNLGEHGV